MADHRRHLACVLAVALTATLPAAASAATATYNFEGVTATGNTGGYTSLSLSDSGLTAIFSRGGTVRFDIRDISSFAGTPAAFGAATLSPFFDPQAAPFLLSFSQAVTGLTFQAGDFFADSDVLNVVAYENADGTGAVVDSVSINYPSSFGFPGDILNPVLSGTFRSVVFIGGSTDFPNSMYFDNFVVTFTPGTAVPAPGALLLMGVGLLGLGLVRRGSAAPARA
jgi:hypothetical protein